MGGLKLEERKNIRLVSGEIDPRTGAIVPVKGAIPLQKVKTAQFTTDGVTVLGDGSTVFDDEFKTDDWIYSLTLNEVRQIKAVTGPNNMELYYGFSADITVAEDVYIVQTQRYKAVQVTNVGNTTARLQEVSFSIGEVMTKEFELGCSPFTYDAVASILSFNLSE